MPDQLHVMIAEARFYDAIADELVAGACAILDAAGATYERLVVPGVFEVPAAIRFASEATKLPDAGHRFDGYIGLGCVIRGETTHYDYVCQESARGLQNLALDHGLAIGYGVLTCENRDQAMARARMQEQDRGGAAARACVAMIQIKQRFGLSG